MQLQYETQDQVPEDLRESFVEFKEGDNTVFLHKDLAETKKEAYRYKGDLTQTQQKQQEALERLKQLEEAESQREAERQAAELESKKKNGQHEEILEHFKQQAELEKQTLTEQLNELKNSVRSEKKTGIVNKLGALGTDITRPMLTRLIEQDLDFGEDGNLVVMENGKATSMTIEQYQSKLPDLYPALIGESHSKGGTSKGGTGSGSPLSKKRSAMTREEKHNFIRDHGQKEFLKLPK